MLRRLVRKVLGRHRGAPGTPVAPAPATEPVADAESMATIDAGAQEIVERVGAGEPVTMVDVRSDEEFAAGAVQGALHIPVDQIAARWEELRDTDEIVCYSGTGERSVRAARLLRERGLFNATSLEGGLAAWTELGGALSGQE